jgi:hypothetical protein
MFFNAIEFSKMIPKIKETKHIFSACLKIPSSMLPSQVLKRCVNMARVNARGMKISIKIIPKKSFVTRDAFPMGYSTLSLRKVPPPATPIDKQLLAMDAIMMGV